MDFSKLPRGRRPPRRQTDEVIHHLEELPNTCPPLPVVHDESDLPDVYPLPLPVDHDEEVFPRLLTDEGNESGVGFFDEFIAGLMSVSGPLKPSVLSLLKVHPVTQAAKQK